ncbi:MAG: TauD/TfdA family dioxygenase [Acidobacteria bacterium]|nr:TauD/TfdA family dioxygenase [Acidobacteriota bacterium]
MKIRETSAPAPLPHFRRKATSVSQGELVKAECLLPESRLPLVIQPAVEDLSLARWAGRNRDYVAARLSDHGALLFRGFGARGVSDLEQFVEAVSGQPMEYRERSSPRSQVSDRVYTSTDHPPDQSIFLHNEHSYAQTFPLKLFFSCVQSAPQGGNTPLADTRKVFERIAPRVRERFIEKKWMYVRNFGDGFGLPWQKVFQTADKAAVETYCRRTGVECEWKDGDRLRTRQVRPVVARHPQTGATVWFNHATFFHVTTLEPQVRRALLDEFAEQDLPNHTYYGDGSPIEDDVMDELRAAYTRETMTFQWQDGDVILLDNMLTSHGREPFAGQRKILFAMAEPYTRTDL